VSRSLSSVDDRHLAEEVALRKLGESQLLLVVVANTDSYPATLYQVHRVALVALPEETRALRHSLVGKQIAQFAGCFVVERGEERHRAKRFERHLTSGL